MRYSLRFVLLIIFSVAIGFGICTFRLNHQIDRFINSLETSQLVDANRLVVSSSHPFTERSVRQEVLRISPTQRDRIRFTRRINLRYTELPDSMDESTIRYEVAYEVNPFGVYEVARKMSLEWVSIPQ